MIERRYPIQSVLAERKMFANGGMVSPPMQQPMQQPMQPMPMQQPMQPMQPQQPQGIMASSQPLVDAIAADALNPQGGGTLSGDDGTLSMAQGGLASEEMMAQGFANGGMFLARPGSREERRMELGRAPKPFSDATVGDYSIFNSELNDAVRLRKMAIDKLRPIQVAPLGETARRIGSAYDYATGTREKKIENDRRRAEEAFRSVGFDSQEELDAERQRIEMIPLDVWLQQSGASGKTREYFLDPDNLGPAYSNLQVGEPDEEEAVPESYQPAERYFEGLVPSGDIEGSIRSQYPSMPNQIVDAVIRSASAPDNQDKSLDEVVSLIAFPEDIERFKIPPENMFEGLVPRGDEDVPGTADTPGSIPVAAGDDSDVPRPKVKPPVPQGPFDAGGDVVAEVDVAGGDVAAEAPVAELVDQGPLPPEDAAGIAAAEVAATFSEKKMEPAEATNAMQKYIDQFKAAMPEYEGASEEERGWAIAEAGLRIMAGQSPDAITNIAKGLQGLGPQFAKDAKEKRAWNRQVELSAAKYGLENVAREAAEDRADERKVFFFYDQTKKTEDNPYGPMVTVSMADIVANGGKIPEGLVEKDLVSKSIASANANTARLQKLITDNAKVYRISATEANTLKEELATSRTAFVSGQIGIDLLATVKAQVAGDKITGLGNAGKELYRRAFKAVNIDVNKKYKDISSARADIRRAFQSLIPLSLGSTQSANSISNRDVQFLADAYINSGFLKDGVLSFATVDSTALGKQLDGAIGKFRESQKQGLAAYESVLERIQAAESGLAGARALGVPVSPGPFGKEYFQSRIKDIRPYAEATRARLEGRRAKPMFTQKSFGALKGFDFIDGKYVPVKPKVK